MMQLVAFYVFLPFMFIYELIAFRRLSFGSISMKNRDWLLNLFGWIMLGITTLMWYGIFSLFVWIARATA